MLDPSTPKFWSDMVGILTKAVGETFYMVGLTLLFTAVIGLLLGLVLVGTDRGGIWERPFGSAGLGRAVHAVLGFIINVGRSLPFVILMVALIPFTRLIMGGTSIGSTAAIVPLTVAASPFFARLVEIAVREVDGGLLEAAHSLGATKAQLVWKVMVPEALPAIVLGLSTTVITIINFSAMAGVLASGGLGDVAYRYGYQRFSTEYMVITIVLLIIIVQVVQSLGGLLARKLSHR